MPDPTKYGTIQEFSQHFASVNTAFERLGFLGHQKAAIYRCLAIIIHLGNIEFEDENPNSAASVKESSNIHLQNATALMKLSSTTELTNLLIFRSIDVCSSEIK